MALEHKRGRPITAEREAPPGRKYCKYGDHYPHIINFKGKDSYCIDCRQKYNRRYYEENKPKRSYAEVEITATMTCLCGAVLEVVATDVGREFKCPRCNRLWNIMGDIRIVHEDID